MFSRTFCWHLPKVTFDMGKSTDTPQVGDAGEGEWREERKDRVK